MVAMAITVAVAIIRWLTAGRLLTGGWHTAIPQDTSGYVLTFLPVGLLILPDVNSLAFGGLKIEMRKTQDEVKKAQGEVAKLGDQIHLLQIQHATAAAHASSGHQFNFGDPATAAAFLTSVRAFTSEKLAETLGDEPSSAVDAFLRPEASGMDQ
jgi:hypothetical protein